MGTHKKILDYVPVLAPDGHEAGRIYFNPHDVGLFQRYLNNRHRIIGIVSPVADCNILPDGCGADSRSAAIIAKARRQLYDLIDEITGQKTAKAAFREYRPFAEIPQGAFWATTVIGALDEVQKRIASNVRKMKI